MSESRHKIAVIYYDPEAVDGREISVWFTKISVVFMSKMTDEDLKIFSVMASIVVRKAFEMPPSPKAEDHPQDTSAIGVCRNVNCANCGAPIGHDDGPPDGWQLEDGRTVCQKCCVLDTRRIVGKIIITPMMEVRHVIWRWTPTQEIRGEPFGDCAEEYAIELKSDAVGGCILWAKWDGKWESNPWSERYVIMQLLKESGNFPNI